MYFNLSEAELTLVNGRPGLVDQVHCAIQIGYFKAKHLFFRLTWNDVEEDVVFILQQYFQGKHLRSISVTQHEYYSQRRAIAAFFEYQRWSIDKTELLEKQISKTLRHDVNPEFIVMELISFLREKRVIRSGYTTLQTIISETLSKNRTRISGVIDKYLSENDILALKKMLVEEENL